MKAIKYGRGPTEISPDQVAEDDAAGGAALGLLGLMTGLSEENWCAGWMSGLEYSLWRIRECEEHPVPDSVAGMGMGRVTDRQRDLLRLLSDECGGWWVSAEEDYSIRFVPLDDWRAHIAERRP